MRVLILDAVVKPNSGGVYTVLKDFYNDALKRKDIDFVFIVGKNNILERQENVEIVLNRRIQKNYLYRVFFDFFFGRKYIEKFDPDVVLSFQNTGVLHLNIPQVVYVHQPISFQKTYHFSLFKSSERKMFFYQYIVGTVLKINLFLLKRSEIIVQTKWMKRAVGRISRAQIKIFKPKIDVIDKELLLKSIENSKSKYLFYPSTAMVYKNHLTLVEAYSKLNSEFKKRMPLKLTITRDEYTRMFGEPSNDIGIEFLGRIPRRKVLELLAVSSLVFPSKLETLGLPLLEAKELGRPIVASKTSPNMETVGSYENVKWFDPDSVPSVIEALQEASVSTSKVQKKFNKNSKNNGWDNLINELETYSVN
ncbi:glycosyltransferase [Oenococcus oeni]|uniref:glycosyltransferase n=1 Tax=Oenococcus oeni TaxID=1247 RepID=UPI00067BE488|nr:glycosyltransferase [Oenococcus oeni]MDI4583618.1 glycosyltransferase [Oenococcus sp. UCMA 14587]MDV7686628.1 glycosyltransferase [Oenococcus oeni]OIL40109.1 hypothetical protein ATX11_00020 [Oenococcus oeni]